MSILNVLFAEVSVKINYVLVASVKDVDKQDLSNVSKVKNPKNSVFEIQFLFPLVFKTCGSFLLR